jgi:F-type H+-transporting ATPase subunit b
MRTMCKLRRGPGALLILLVWLALLSIAAFAQQNASPAASGAASASAEPQQASAPSEQKSGESQSGEEQFKHSPSVRFLAKVTGTSLQQAYWLAVLLNFGVIAFAIGWVSKKKLPGMFRNRTASIQKAMEEARKASEEANRRLAEIEGRLAKLDVEIGAMRAAAEKEAAAEEARIKAAAEEDARKVIESAEQEIAAAAKNARRELTAYAADLAVALARKQIQVDAATDQGLVRSFADQLTLGGNAPRKGGN